MLNRQIVPPLFQPEEIRFPEPFMHQLPGEIPLVMVNEGTQEVIKIELIFTAGNINNTIPFIAAMTNELIDEGTIHHSSAEIAESLDNFGAYLHTECGNDFASVTLFTLSKFLPETLPILMEIITEAAYPEKEIVTFCTQEKQRLAVNLEKVDFLARKHFINKLYGDKHPYGHFPSIADTDSISKNHLTDFHKNNYLNGLIAVIVAGKFSDTQQQFIIQTLDTTGFKKGKLPVIDADLPSEGRKIHIPKKDSIQSAIRIGRRLFNRKHKDYFPLSILNTVLGGYFGSRLMSNIREDKGYTYGIGSGLISHIRDGYFFISTEVGAEVCTDAVAEIYKELKLINNFPVPIEELNLVKSYLFGAFQRSMDGPFALADRYKILILNDLKIDYYKNYLEILKNISPEELLLTGRQHIDPVHLTEVIIGQ